MKISPMKCPLASSIFMACEPSAESPDLAVLVLADGESLLTLLASRTLMKMRSGSEYAGGQAD